MKPNYQPAVLVLGLLPSQVALITKEFHDRLDMRFWKDQSARQLKADVKRADHVVVMTSKSPHVAQVLASTHKNAIRCPGGMSSLRLALTQLAAAS